MGVAQWSKTKITVADDGELTVVIPGFYESTQARHLREVLPQRLNAVSEPLVVSVNGAQRDSKGNYETLGSIVIRGFREPWPNPEELRAAVAEEVEAGQQAEDEAQARLYSFRAHMSPLFES